MTTIVAGVVAMADAIGVGWLWFAPAGAPERLEYLPAGFKTAAVQLVREGVTSKDPELVAAILAEHAAGTPPCTIGRRQNVHHSTVSRIVNAAQAVTI